MVALIVVMTSAMLEVTMEGSKLVVLVLYFEKMITLVVGRLLIKCLHRWLMVVKTD